MLKTFPNVRWLSSFNASTLQRFNGIIFSNELLDAMPVRRFAWDAKANEWFEWGVALDKGKFIWTRLRKNVAAARQSAANIASECWPSSILKPPSSLLGMLPDGFTIETSPAAENWWREAANALGRGKLLAIDYGLTADELFVPERTGGTLRAYFRHHATDDLLANPGEQDLTAHVNFTAIQTAGEAAGLKTERFESQSKFLTQTLEKIANGGMESWDWTPQRARQFQTLTHPEHLGRAFRVLVQSRKEC